MDLKDFLKIGSKGSEDAVELNKDPRYAVYNEGGLMDL
jgi:hypothetical protein